jgi:putative tryptophan/tyrosine transport system substrate-binding protein
MDWLERRAFITLLGGAAAAPALLSSGGVLAQQAMPVIGCLYNTSPDPIADRLRAFRQGLNETAYVEGDNVTILYRFAENQNERMPELAADLVRRQFQLFEIMLMAQWVTAKSAKA